MEKISRDHSKSSRLPVKLPSLVHVRKLGHVNFSDHFMIASHNKEKPITEKPKVSDTNKNHYNPIVGQLTWALNNKSYVVFLWLVFATNALLFGQRIWDYKEANVAEMMARAFGESFKKSLNG